MDKVAENTDTSVKLSKNALKKLESKARPFESKKDCLERIITQNCGVIKDEEKPNEYDSDLDESDRTPQEKETE